MAKYEVKMSCGHTETIQMFGKMTDRDKKIAWLEEHGICTACYKARQDAAHAEETAAAKAKADEENLPALTGSEKQVNWALSIRAKKFADLDKMLADMTTTDEQRQQNQIALQAAKNVLSRKTQSRFWIDNRNTPARKLIAQNGLQDEIKAEFARLTTAEATSATEEVDPEEYVVSTEAFDIAANAEIELATNTNDNITKDEHEPEASTMTITTTTNKAGRISGYYVDGVKTRKADIDFIINRRRDEIIEVDYHVGTEFRALTRSPYQLKVVFTGMEHPIMTQAAADELGYKIVKAFSGSYNGTVFVVEKKTDVDKSTIDNTTTTDVDDDDNDDDDVFALLPELDKLNDVSDIAPVIQPLRQTFVFTPVGNERHQILTSDDVVTFLNGKLHHITSTKYAAWFSVCFCHYAWHIFKDGKIDGVNGTNDEEEFFSEMAKRGACEPEPPPVDDYDIKRQKRFARNQLLRKWNAELADLKAALSKMSGKHQKRGVIGTYKLEFGLYVTTTNDECKYLLKVASLPIGIYDTPAQVDKVIDMLREAIERGDKEFKFPTVDELNQPPIDTDLERKIGIEESLRRAMEAAYAEHERFLRLAATSYNKGTRSDCFREADNELKLYNICWQATNELWSERW